MTLPARDKRPLAMVVDDDPMMQLLVGEALEEAGFDRREVLDGVTAVELFPIARPDLVLLDVVMPEMDGFETCAAMRDLPNGVDVPILMMTGSDDIHAIHRAFEAGATDFITKPINYPVLGHRLRYMQRTREKLQELKTSRQRLADAQRLARLGHWEWNLVTGHLSLSAQSAMILGVDPIHGCPTISDMLASVHPDDRERVLDAFDGFIRTQEPLHLEHKVVRPDGSEAILYQEAEPAIDEVTGRLRLTGAFQDISERKRTEQRVAHLEFHDSLTGLPNRSFFTEYTDECLGGSGPDERLVAVYEIDIDQLQRFNDTLGHIHGGELAVAATRRIAEALGVRISPASEWLRVRRPLLSRAPSGSLLFLHPALESAELAMDPAQTIVRALEGSFRVGEQEVVLTASIGVSVGPVDGNGAEDLLRNAHAARQSVKRTGGSGFAFYAKNMNENALERLRLETALRRAVEEESFTLCYQPKVRISDERPIGLEALLRWEAQDLGPVSPGKFIPLAEEHGLVVPIGRWVIQETCRQLVEWDGRGLPPLRCSVNVAAQQLDEDGLVDAVRDALEETGLEPSRLEIELTERAFMHDTARVIEILDQLRELGCRISLDDFGTGYSSLSYLTKFPIDVLKLDRSFILDVPVSEDQSILVASLVDLAKKLRLEVVAEGVEEQTQVDFLRGTGCDQIQGFFYSKPLKPAELEAWVAEREEARLEATG